jgi:DNA topoisomerase-1
MAKNSKKSESDKTLIIVESPSKATKIQEYLGDDYIVVASKGHITDLVKNGAYNLGIDLNSFTPRYTISPDKVDIVDQLLSFAKQSKLILLSSDPDREGEAISWHLYERLKDTDIPIKRIVFNEITKAAIKKAINSPRDIDMDLVHAQEARRILDRIVGFMASPFLMNHFKSKLSAGRVQSVVTKMIIDREKEIDSFIPEDYWNIHVSLSNGSDNFSAKYDTRITDQKTANLVENALKGNIFVVSEVVAKDEKRAPFPPLITSKLQQIMSKDHGFSADRTMKAAQALYESGYCTYLRTDSTRIGDDAMGSVRDWIKSNNYDLPKNPNVYQNKDSSQDAHECIRPTEIELLPNQNYEIIDPDQKKVYEVIWKFFVASQMNPAIYNTLKVTLHPKGNPSYKIKASGKALKYKGFLEILGIVDDSKIDIPLLNVGDELNLFGKSPVKVEKKQTQPTARYSEATLIKELVNKDIGRPATYAELLTKIVGRNYVEKQGNIYHGTELGKKICNILDSHFTFMDYNYTSLMEKKLDSIAGKNLNHIEMLKNFYQEFKKELDQAYIDDGGEICIKCGSPMLERSTRNGERFLGCSAYPSCKSTKNLEQLAKSA